MASEDTKYRDTLLTMIEATGLITTMGIAANMSSIKSPIDWMDLSERMTQATANVKELIELMDKDLSIEKGDDNAKN